MSQMQAGGSPQDPYASFLVAASAGSGKTYQLSRRFLHLVAAGAKPGTILTVTFTKKAAGEMRARILEEAARLTVDTKAQARFDAERASFHAAALRRGLRPPPSRRAAEVGHTILAQSQSLTISTIDSLFVEWLRKFPYEASPEAEQTGAAFPSPFALLDPAEERTLRDAAWAATCQLLSRGLKRDEDPLRLLLADLPEQDVRSAAGRVFALDRLDTYLWYAERHVGDGQALSDLSLDAALADDYPQDDAALVEHLEAPLLAIALVVSNDERRAAAQAAVGRRDLDELVASGLITKAFAVSGNVVRGKKRDQLAAEILEVETSLRAFINHRKRQELGRHGNALYGLYRIYRQLRDHLKQKRGLLEFRDLAKGAYRLFHGDAGLGARLLLARTVRHVMLDEFQDTSRLQWGIFAEMASSMLAGDGIETDDGGPAPSVFIVGDIKQSIYGFREADPTVMTDAAVVLQDRLQVAPLNDSYRTAQIVLDYVNQVFADALPEFPRHTTATSSDSGAAPVPFVPDVGRVMVAPLAEGTDDQDGEEREAELVADVVQAALRQEVAFPVYDKASGSHRPPRAGDVAILYRSTTKAALFEAALRRRGIACQREEARGFFARPEIADSVALLRYLALPADVVSLCTVLRSPLVGIPDVEVLRLLAETKAQRHDAGRAGEILAGIRSLDPKLGAILSSLRGRTDSVLPHVLLGEALAQLDAFGAYGRPSLYPDLPPEVAEATEAPLARRNLIGLVELLLELEDDGLTNLPAVLRRLESLAETDDTGNAQLGGDAVTLMTIHKSKGLEFPIVAVVDSGRPWGRRDALWLQSQDADGRPRLSYIGRGEDQPTGDPDFDELLESAARETAEECNRLLYVALTRARQYLLVTGHQPGRKVGLAETVLYEALRSAMEHSTERGAPSTLAIGPHHLLQWETGTETRVDEAAPGGPAAPLPLETARPSTGLPREMRIVSPSRHEAPASGAGATALGTLPWGDSGTATAVGHFLHAGMEAFLLDAPFDHLTVWQQLAPASTRDGTLGDEVTSVLEAARRDDLWAKLKSEAVRLETEMSVVHKADAQTLVRGTLDLLVELPGQRLLVIDYKATRFAEPSVVTHDALKRFATSRAWQEQLEAYAAALRVIHPGFLVETAVYFLTLGQLVRL